MGKPSFRTERGLFEREIWPVAGIDEAGRGPIAGPVAAAAVILNPRRLPRGLQDSKLLCPEDRDRVYQEIMLRALAVSVSFISAAEIDAINIRQATFAAMRRALHGLAVAPCHALIDGNDPPPDLSVPAEAIVKGDAAISSIAAASIVAKVTRDRLMRQLCSQYPAYRFSEHFGYATKAHLAAIAEHGPCPLHRMSFSPFAPG
jgi:ribonuclease HII